MFEYSSIANDKIAMEINLDTKYYECQCDVEYWYEDTLNGKARKSTSLKADIYFDSMRKSLELRQLECSVPLSNNEPSHLK